MAKRRNLDQNGDEIVNVFEENEKENATHLSKRELFAAMAMQGLISNSERIGNSKECSETAVLCADALIEELNKPQGDK